MAVDVELEGTEIPGRERIRVTASQAMEILLPYSGRKLREQILTVAPVCLYLVFFQLIVLRYTLAQAGWITGGILLVILGLVLFLEGVRIGLVPLGETIGDAMPGKSRKHVVLTFAFLLGVLAAFGEPVLGSLQIAGAAVDSAKAPLLSYLLVERPIVLSITVSLGVGVAVLVGILRFIKGWSLKVLILTLVAVALVLTLAAGGNHVIFSAAGLAWDTGAVIVGPVLCPLVLSLGLGVCRATGRSDTAMAGFGMVGLISVMPITAVLVLVYALSFVLGGRVTAGAAALHAAASAALSGTPFFIFAARDSFVLSVRAALPIFAFLCLFMRLILKERGIPASQLVLGIAFAILGLFFFNFGLSVGLAQLGSQVGQRLPLSFHPPEAALFPGALGKIIVVAFGGILGYGATLAEPAFNILGQQVEDITQGAFKKWLFGQAVALGVGIGAALGIASVTYGINLLYVLVPPYAVLFLLTILNEEKYVNIAWDGGAVTTGPVTVPLKISIGIALSHATGFAEGFGILALASAYPVLNILVLGLYVKHFEKKLNEQRLAQPEAGE